MKTFVVLGMHRSATSLVAQGLHRCDIFMGEKLLGPHESNPYGHWEDVSFIGVNDKILQTAGGAWDNPPQETAIIEAGKELAEPIRRLIERKEKEPFWGWKDPRTTLTIKCFLPYLTNPHFICCFRDPVDVAKSLAKRDGTPVGEGYALAIEYNRRLLEFLAGEYLNAEII